MFKFLSGVVVGWVSARALPPPENTSDRLKPPTSDELYSLIMKAKKAGQHVLHKLDSPSSS